MAKKTKKKSPILLRVMARMGDLQFKEGYLSYGTNGRSTLGMWENDGTIVINPIPEVVDTIIHEILHDLFPHYSERAILSLTGKLYRQLSEEELQTIYDEYKKRVELSPRLQKIENEK